MPSTLWIRTTSLAATIILAYVKIMVLEGLHNSFLATMRTTNYCTGGLG